MIGKFQERKQMISVWFIVSGFIAADVSIPLAIFLMIIGLIMVPIPQRKKREKIDNPMI